jgi:hypothetical protein
VREVVRRYHEKIELHPQADKMTRSAFDPRAPLEIVAQAVHAI